MPNTTITGYLIRADKTHTAVEIREDHQLDDLYAAINCRTFDVVSLEHGIDLFVDDEGLINRSRLNLALTIIAFQLGAPTPIFGNGVLIGGDDRTGKTVNLTRAQLDSIQTALNTPPDDATTAAIAAALTRRIGPATILHSL